MGGAPGSLVGIEARDARARAEERDATDQQHRGTPHGSAEYPRTGGLRLPSWRRESLRTTFWVVPTILIAVACLLFAVTFEIDLAAFHHRIALPWWVRTGSADAGRQVLIAIAAAIITSVGVVFSITILALTLASQQFGPRMMRNFVRDIGNQMTLGVFVATFVYSVLALGSITGLPTGDFVPHLSITVAEALLLVDLAVLIYFIHHIAKSIQLPEVIAGIARDLDRAIHAEFPRACRRHSVAVTTASRPPPTSCWRPWTARGRGHRRAQRLPAVRGLRQARRDRRVLGRGHPLGAPTGALRRRPPAAGHGLAGLGRRTRWRPPSTRAT